MAYWDKVPAEVKERNLVIMLPPGVDRGETVPGTEHGRFIKIPLPYGFNAFAMAASTAADMVRNASDPVRGVSPGKGALRILKAFVGAWVPVSDVAPSFDNPKATAMLGVPDALDPVMEAVLNVNSFGRQLYPEGMGQDKLPDSEKVWGAQKGTWKHSVARWLNENTGGSMYHEGAISVTPASIDNVARGYGGGVTTFLSSLADTLVTQGVSRDRVEWWRAPFVKQLYGEVDTMADQALAYDRLSQIEQAAKAIRDEFGPMADLGKAAQAARQRLTKIRKEEIRIIQDDGLSDAAKNAGLRGWERERQAVFDRLNRTVNQTLVDGQAP
ncbi:MAG: LPD38 domain-containing protein [Pseudomonadota bacterium]